MSFNKKLIWSGLGWVMGGPIGAILGYAFASMDKNSNMNWKKLNRHKNYNTRTTASDFAMVILVLFAKVMKADGKLLKSELDYIKKFLIKQFGLQQAREYMKVFKDILKQDYPVKNVCIQIRKSMDHSSRLEIIHVLFGLSASDGETHSNEISVIRTIANYLNINKSDFESLKAIFYKDDDASYKILEISDDASDSEIKKAFRKMANKYHPDKVSHLGKKCKKMLKKNLKQSMTHIKKLKCSRFKIKKEKPGKFPFTRGIYENMYRDRFWTMRQYAGYTSAIESNKRYHYLLNSGVMGLSVAFDLPTQIGYDSDHAMAEGEVGKVGVPISHISDMDTLFKDIPLNKVSTSMTINATAATMLAFYIAVSKKTRDLNK